MRVRIRGVPQIFCVSVVAVGGTTPETKPAIKTWQRSSIGTPTFITTIPGSPGGVGMCATEGGHVA